MKILENLWQVGGAEYTSVEDAAIYLIRFGEKAALIDAGCGGAHDDLVLNISDVLPPEVAIEYLFLTHCHYDHTGGAEAVRDQYGCRIVAHELDAAFLETGDSIVTAATWYGARMNPLKIDYHIKTKEEAFQIGDGRLVAHHCPGHSPGSVVYQAELNSRRVLFGQDVHGPLDDSFLSNRDDYKQSLKFLTGLNADILCEGHFGVYRGKLEVRRFIQTYLGD
ncbi:MAG: MBL fold metallo-hydrolase [Desulfobacteraceae bacterium]|jgi:glyoxylase-like metal-dependent hydrolase (beta-lactamase superfamily II)|nr:MBL fold metallo-hydrolase [Desulfobacteraceae bacterium]